MNADYAGLLPLDLKLDYALLGRAVKAEILRRRLTLGEVQEEARVSRASVSRITTGFPVKIVPVLRLCIWLDLNPFELLQPMGDLPSEKLFHGNTVLKLSEIAQENFGDRP